MPWPDISRLSVVACFAHPDDEGFASGGLLAKLADGGTDSYNHLKGEVCHSSGNKF